MKDKDVDKKSHFLEKFKTKSKELGFEITSELITSLSQTTSLLQASIGNELVIATFAPMIPKLIYDEVTKRLFVTEVSDLGNRLDAIKDKLNYQFIQSDEGSRLFQKIVEEMLTNSEEEKIEYLKRFITSSFVLEHPEELKVKKFREILTQTSSLDLKLLQLFCKPQKFIHELIPTKNKLFAERKAIDQLLLPIDLNDYCFKVDEGLFHTSYTSLINWGLIQHKNQKLNKNDDAEPDNTAIYTLQSYWGFGQGNFYIKKDRRHARKYLKEKHSENVAGDEIIEACLSSLTMAFVTNFGWDFMCMIDDSIQSVNTDENLELES